MTSQVSPPDPNPHRADMGLIRVCIVGVFVASVLLGFSIYSGIRWIAHSNWLGASTPGFEWVPVAVGYGALAADLVGVAMAVTVFWKGRWTHRLLVALPSVLLLGYLAFAVLKSVFPGL